MISSKSFLIFDAGLSAGKPSGIKATTLYFSGILRTSLQDLIGDLQSVMSGQPAQLGQNVSPGLETGQQPTQLGQQGTLPAQTGNQNVNQFVQQEGNNLIDMDKLDQYNEATLSVAKGRIEVRLKAIQDARAATGAVASSNFKLKIKK